MNNTKRNLILASSIINIIAVTINLIISIISGVNPSIIENNYALFYVLYLLFGYGTDIVSGVFIFAIGLVGSILLMYSIRSKGKYFRRTQGCYIAGFIIVIFCGKFLTWVLLFISLFIPDIIVMNRPSELRREQKVQDKETILSEKAYAEKVEKIEELKRLRDNGTITEEEYKEKLFELL